MLIIFAFLYCGYMNAISIFLCKQSKGDLIHIIKYSDAPLNFKLKAGKCLFFKFFGFRK